jgi:hypothetical protein
MLAEYADPKVKQAKAVQAFCTALKLSCCFF